jgi:dipeptidyl aminopeptidase/acylaminoacyl peptidase
VPFYGIYDFTNSFGQQPDDGMLPVLERFILKKPFRENRRDYEKASPVFRVHAEAPPFFVVHGTHDTLAPVAEARVFVDALRKASRATVCYAELPEAHHAFEVFQSPRTAHVVQAVDRFLATIYSDYLAKREAE